MGFFDTLFGGGESPRPGAVRGTARVISGSRPAPHATHSNFSGTLVVELPGLPAYQTEYRKLVCRADKWPRPGSVLPVLVHPQFPHEVTVLWDEMPTGWQAGRQQAAMLVDQLNNPGGSPVPGSGPTASPNGPTVVAGRTGEDPVTRLQKLAGLRDAGIVTDEQFRQLRAQILRQAGLDDG